MKKTLMTGSTCVGELRLTPLDVGFDIRLHNMEVEFVKPAMERHMRFLDKVEMTMESVTLTQHAIVKRLESSIPTEADR